MQAISEKSSGNWVEQHPLLFSLGISLAVHVVLFTVAAGVLGTALLRDPELLKQIAQSPEKIIELTAQSLEKQRPPEEERQVEVEKQMPMLYIDIDPSKAAAEAPEKTKYYAAQNVLASNPDTRLDTEQPKIDGRQTQIVRAFDAQKSQPQPMPLQPTPPPQAKVEAQPQKTAQSEQAAKSQKAQKNQADQAKQTRGELEKLRPEQNRQDEQMAKDETTPRQRPKSVALAKAQQGDSRPPGERMKQEGGVRLSDIDSRIAASGTPLGMYDAKIIDAIRNKWYALLEDTKHARDRKGHVVIEFRLYSNGTVRNVRTSEEDVGEFLAYICQSAIMTPAPYEKWPDDVRAAVGKDYRDVKFTFFYN